MNRVEDKRTELSEQSGYVRKINKTNIKMGRKKKSYIIKMVIK